MSAGTFWRAGSRLALWLCAALALGCASRPAPGPKLTPLNEIEPELAELWRAYRESAAPGGLERWEAARARALEDPRATRFLVDNLGAEMVAAFEREDALTKASPASRFLRARAELVRLGAPAVPLLVGMLSADEVLARLGGDTLELIGPPAGMELLRALESDDVKARRRVCELLVRLPPLGAGDPFLVAALERAAASEPDLQARAFAIEALGARAAACGEGPRVEAQLVALLEAPEGLYAGRAARGLARLGELRLAPVLLRTYERGLRSGDALLRRELQAALVLLAPARGRPLPRPAPNSLTAWRAFFAAPGG